MIDYLERLFAVEEDGREEKPEVQFRFFPPEEESAEQMKVPALPAEQEKMSSVLRKKTEERGQSPARSRRLSPLDPEELARVSMEREEAADGAWDRVNIRRSEPQGGAQELERRLRRDSRRYDSGFFWF